MYNCIPMHTLQTLQDMQRLSPREFAVAFVAAAVAAVAVSAALVLVAFFVAMATVT